MENQNHNNQNQTKKASMFKLIKPKFLIFSIFIFSALIFTTLYIGLKPAYGLVNVPNGRRLYALNTEPIMGPPESNNQVCSFQNTSSSKDYFIPTRYGIEWDAVKSAANYNRIDVNVDCDISILACTFIKSNSVTNGYINFNNFNMGAITVELWGAGGGGQGGDGGSGWPGAVAGFGGLGGLAGYYENKVYTFAPSYAYITIGSGGAGGAGGEKNLFGDWGSFGNDSKFVPPAPLIGLVASGGSNNGSLCAWSYGEFGCGESGGKAARGEGTWAFYSAGCGPYKSYGAGGHGGDGGRTHSGPLCNASSGSSGLSGSSGAIKLTYEYIGETCPDLCINNADCGHTSYGNWYCAGYDTRARSVTTYSCVNNECQSSTYTQTDTCWYGYCSDGYCVSEDCSLYYNQWECENAGCNWDWGTQICTDF